MMSCKFTLGNLRFSLSFEKDSDGWIREFYIIFTQSKAEQTGSEYGNEVNDIRG